MGRARQGPFFRRPPSTRSAKAALAATIAFSAAILAGCQTLHADLSDAEMETRVRAHFDPGLSVAQTEKRLYRMNWIESIHRTDDGDVRAAIWPKKFLGVVGGIRDYYGRELLLFRFGSDDALDEVVFRPGNSSARKDRGELVIDLEEPRQ